MAPREREIEELKPNSFLDEEEDEENEEYNIGNGAERREYLAEVRVHQVETRERANRELARNTELQYELRQSVTAMEQMIESQQRIERIQRSLTYLRDLHSRMIDAGIGQGSDSEDEDSEEEDINDEDIERIISRRTATQLTINDNNSSSSSSNNNNNRIPPANTKRVQTISESSDVSMKDEDQGTT